MGCGGNLDRDDGELGLREKEELDLLKTTLWCFFAYCFGFGCNSPGGSDACCKVEGKLCCLWAIKESCAQAATGFSLSPASSLRRESRIDGDGSCTASYRNKLCSCTNCYLTRS